MAYNQNNLDFGNQGSNTQTNFNALNAGNQNPLKYNSREFNAQSPSLRFDQKKGGDTYITQQPSIWSDIGTGIGAATDIFGSAMNYLNYQNASESLDFQKDSWQKNYDQNLAALERNLARQDSRDRDASGDRYVEREDRGENK